MNVRRTDNLLKVLNNMLITTIIADVQPQRWDNNYFRGFGFPPEVVSFLLGFDGWSEDGPLAERERTVVHHGICWPEEDYCVIHCRGRLLVTQPTFPYGAQPAFLYGANSELIDQSPGQD